MKLIIVNIFTNKYLKRAIKLYSHCPGPDLNEFVCFEFLLKLLVFSVLTLATNFLPCIVFPNTICGGMSEMFIVFNNLNSNILLIQYDNYF